MAFPRIVLSAAAWASALGAIEGARVAARGHGAETIAAGAGSGLVVGVLLSILQIAVVRVAERVERRAGLGAW